MPNLQNVPVIKFEKINVLILFLVLLGILLETLGQVSIAGISYTCGLFTAGATKLHLSQLPKTRSALSLSIWASSLAICLAPVTLIFFPSYAVHFWHFIFISGLGLLTIFVSLRVTLAHSGQDFLVWEKRRIFYFVSFLILCTAVTRVVAPFFPESAFRHYSYAAMQWILALGIWAFFFFYMLLLERRTNSSDRTDC